MPWIGPEARADSPILGLFRPPLSISVGRLAPRRQLYGAVVPALLLGVALLAYLSQTEGMFAFAAFALGLISLYSFGDLLFGKSAISCGKIVAVGLLMEYGLTSLNTWFSIRGRSGSLSAFVEEDQATLSIGIAVLAVSAALLFLMGEWAEREVAIDLGPVATTEQAKWFVLVSFAIVVVAFLRGDLTYMGESHSQNGKISVLSALAGWLVAPLFGMTVAVALSAKDRWQKVAFWALAAAQAVLAVPLGRRIFLYTMFVGGVAARFGPIRRKGIVWKRVIVVGLGIGGMYVASIAFLYLRVATYELDVNPSLGAIVTEAYRVSQTTNYTVISASLRENAIERGFILGWFSDLIKQSETHKTAEGQDIADAMIMQIPSAIWKEKLANLPPGEEDLANSVFGTNYPDQANSVLTAGAVDFGVAGAILYPLVAAGMISIFLRMMAAYTRPLTAAIVTLAAIYLMLNVEEGFEIYFVFVRNSILFAFILHVTGRFRPAWRRSAGNIPVAASFPQ